MLSLLAIRIQRPQLLADHALWVPYHGQNPSYIAFLVSDY